MKRNYRSIDKQGKMGERKLTEFLVHNGQALLPMLELIDQSRTAIDELINVMGRVSVEVVLEPSAQQVAGPQHRGKARWADIVWHGTQPGRVSLKERRLRVNKHVGYEISQRKRPLIEKVFGWMKQVGGMRKAKLRGLWKVGWQFLMTAAAFNLWRIPKLRAAQA